MATTNRYSSVIQRAFSAGELAPAMHARADLLRYATGLRTCRNFFIKREGGIANRAGFQYVATTKASSVQLMRYESELAGQSILIEAGESYLRFYKDGAPITVSGVSVWDSITTYFVGDLVEDGSVYYYAIQANTGIQPPESGDFWYPLTGDLYEVPAPAGFTLVCEWTQSGYVMTLTRSDQAPLYLTYLSDTRWVLTTVTTGSSVIVPDHPTGLAGDTTGLRTYAYVITAVEEETYEESEASDVVTLASIGPPSEDAPNTLSWDAVAGAVEYRIYCDPFENGVYGFVGTAAATGSVESFNDTGFVPDFQVTPPVVRTLFAATTQYPNIAAYHQQRQLFAYTDSEPDIVHLSQVGYYENFNIHSPLQDDDALTFRLTVGTHNHPVRWAVSLRDLVLGTDGGLVIVTGDESGVLKPGAINADQYLYVGAGDKKPVVVGQSLIYLQARKSKLVDARFSREVDGWWGRDLTVYAAHLFDGETFARLDYAQAPHSIVWAVRNDGTLLGLSYLPEHDIWGWHRHDTGASGVFEDVCVIPEADQDAVYCIIKRTINSVEVRYIERMAPRFVDPDDFDGTAIFLDACVTYDGSATTAISGLDHLEAASVYALADGDVQGPFTVASGAITLTTAASVVHTGLLITADAETLDLDIQGSDIRDKRKRVQGIKVLLNASSRVFQAGPDSSSLQSVTLDGYQSVADTFTGPVDMAIYSRWTDEGRVFLRQAQPLPLEILSIIPRVEAGG